MKDERSERIEVDPRLAQDPNYIAYKAQEALLKQEHMGEWVAFCNGELVGLAPDRETLFKETQAKGFEGFFYKEIVAKERIAHLRSPRVIRGRFLPE